ncbi:tRNA pseudouridine(38-40) synthase TruA [Metabacillus fastidiosus]|uniref:tRNA pseudouridine(38-40) synthase TruA n=1 Tax=Metabacillus fastidiosus TaxID=1458 RepID=UPI002E1F95F0|nr:tRNA pseudouridine(38-40) synthase TruA [Metabacillus fastidiosus]MED4456314.1 tRNA pseudouridine(38-40) synthase TruA [Metabacillus fastidiosus]
MKIKCKISYDGTQFSGYQVQPNKRTVQSELEAVLSKIHKNPVKVYASGRTDASVHAVGQVVHFDTSLTIPFDRWKKALNAMLPDDISVTLIEEAGEGFHARFSAKAKEYHYIIDRSEQPDIFKRNYRYHFPYKLDVHSMREACELLQGTHDFTSFCAAKSAVEDRVRTIHKIEIEEVDNELVFSFIGNGFLYNMVRILVGTLLDVGQGIIVPQEIPNIIDGKDRNLSGKTVPGHGLFLWKVYYDN